MTATYPPLDGTQPCREDPQLFFPGKSDPGATKKAKALCRHCDFQPACLQYALIYDLHGTWGGTTATERRTYQRARKIQPIPVTVPHALGGRLPTQGMANRRTTNQNGPR